MLVTTPVARRLSMTEYACTVAGVGLHRVPACSLLQHWQMPPHARLLSAQPPVQVIPAAPLLIAP